MGERGRGERVVMFYHSIPNHLYIVYVSYAHNVFLIFKFHYFEIFIFGE